MCTAGGHIWTGPSRGLGAREGNPEEEGECRRRSESVKILFACLLGFHANARRLALARQEMSHGASNLCAEHFYERNGRGGRQFGCTKTMRDGGHGSPVRVGVFYPGNLYFEKWMLFVFYVSHVCFFSSLRALRVK